MNISLVYAVVTNWNAYEDTVECVQSTLASTYQNVRIVIVDNGSTDDTAEKLEVFFPEIPIVRTGHNGAVTAAYNKGIQYALDDGADYVLMLNNDTKLDQVMISKLVETAESENNIGLVTPKIYYYDRPNIIWFAGGNRHHFDFGAYNTSEGQPDVPENNDPKEVDYAWACGMLFRRSTLEDIGLFDTRFFLYYDDVDMSVRTQQAGYRILYVPDAKMWHKVSASTGSHRFAKTWARSKILLYRKHTTGLHLFFLIMYAYVHAFARYIFPTRQTRKIRGFLLSYLQGLNEGLRWQNNH